MIIHPFEVFDRKRVENMHELVTDQAVTLVKSYCQPKDTIKLFDDFIMFPWVHIERSRMANQHDMLHPETGYAPHFVPRRDLLGGGDISSMNQYDALYRSTQHIFGEVLVSQYYKVDGLWNAVKKRIVDKIKMEILVDGERGFKRFGDNGTPIDAGMITWQFRNVLLSSLISRSINMSNPVIRATTWHIMNAILEHEGWWYVNTCHNEVFKLTTGHVPLARQSACSGFEDASQLKLLNAVCHACRTIGDVLTMAGNVKHFDMTRIACWQQWNENPFTDALVFSDKETDMRKFRKEQHKVIQFCSERIDNTAMQALSNIQLESVSQHRYGKLHAFVKCYKMTNQSNVTTDMQRTMTYQTRIPSCSKKDLRTNLARLIQADLMFQVMNNLEHVLETVDINHEFEKCNFPALFNICGNKVDKKYLLTETYKQFSFERANKPYVA